MENFEFGEEIEKVFLSCYKHVTNQKKTESSCRIKPQTFRFTAQILKSLK